MRSLRAGALLWLLLSIAAAARADAAPAALTLRDYLEAVAAGNADLQAQRESIVAAQAAVSIAGVRPDPVFTGGVASKELYGPNQPSAGTALTAGVALTLETAGKREARVRAARSGVALTRATVGAFAQSLDADAAAAFVEACRSRAVVERKRSSLAGLRAVVRANEARWQAGDIGRLELTQSQLEAGRFEADVVGAQADAAAADVALAVYLGTGGDAAFTARTLSCDWPHDATAPPVASALDTALATRPDVRAAQAAIDSAQDALDLARANRWVDPVLNVGLTNTPRINPLLGPGGAVVNYPAERSIALGVTVSVPIPLSRLQQGETAQAASALAQARLQWQATALKAEGDVRATLVQYAAATQTVAAYGEHLIVDAERVLAGARLSYQHGASTLLELLDAQRSADEVWLAYQQAIADHANARVRLLLSLGQTPVL